MKIMNIMSISRKKQKKRTVRPFRQGCSTIIATTNKSVSATHIHLKVRMSKCDKFNIKVSSTHKELADGAKKKKKESLSSKIDIKVI